MLPIIAVSGLGATQADQSSVRCRTRARPWGATQSSEPSCQPRPQPWSWMLPPAPPAISTPPKVAVVRAPVVVAKPPPVVKAKPAPVVTVKPAPTVVKCEPGMKDCACRADSTCDRGSRCVAHTCVPCKLGTHKCQCDDNGKCPGRTSKTGKLYCKSGICKKRVHHGIWPFSSTSYEGLGEEPAAPLWAWAGIIGLTGFIFWSTLRPPRLPIGR
jgi:hypothetical protein